MACQKMDNVGNMEPYSLIRYLEKSKGNIGTNTCEGEIQVAF